MWPPPNWTTLWNTNNDANYSIFWDNDDDDDDDQITDWLLLQMVTRTKKVFVGGLSAQTTLDDVRAYFEQFGLVSSQFPLLLASFLSRSPTKQAAK